MKTIILREFYFIGLYITLFVFYPTLVSVIIVIVISQFLTAFSTIENRRDILESKKTTAETFKRLNEIEDIIKDN